MPLAACVTVGSGPSVQVVKESAKVPEKDTIVNVKVERVVNGTGLS